uniref:hypothetical protein n=1 Tax=Marisediminitalea sp. TaxID=2662268 RepID=UPI003511E90C
SSDLSGIEYLKKYLGENYICRKDSFLSLFRITPCLKVLQSEILFARVNFEGGLSNYDGLDIYKRFFILIFSEVKRKAKEIDFSLVSAEDKIVVFSNMENLIALGFDVPAQAHVWHHPKNLEWKGIVTNELDIFLVFPDRLELHATYFESGFGRYPFLMVFSQNNNSLKVDSYAYLDFIFENDAAFKLTNS